MRLQLALSPSSLFRSSARPFPMGLQQPRFAFAPRSERFLKRIAIAANRVRGRLDWFEVQPVYWLARKAIVEVRPRLNFSKIGSRPEAAQKAALMPLPR